jgi:hypothetical protein
MTGFKRRSPITVHVIVILMRKSLTIWPLICLILMWKMGKNFKLSRKTWRKTSCPSRNQLCAHEK